MNTHYPSQQEVQQKMHPALAQIRSETEFAEFAASATSVIRYREIVGERSIPSEADSIPSNTEGTRPTPKLFADQLNFLGAVGEGKATTAVYDALDISPGKGNRIKQELLHCGLIIEEQIPNPKGTGRPLARLRLSESGKEVLREGAGT